jgi:hypothetical protein
MKERVKGRITRHSYAVKNFLIASGTQTTVQNTSYIALALKVTPDLTLNVLNPIIVLLSFFLAASA